jgi:hypothetical protein
MLALGDACKCLAKVCSSVPRRWIFSLGEVCERLANACSSVSCRCNFSQGDASAFSSPLLLDSSSTQIDACFLAEVLHMSALDTGEIEICPDNAAEKSRDSFNFTTALVALCLMATRAERNCIRALCKRRSLSSLPKQIPSAGGAYFAKKS